MISSSSSASYYYYYYPPFHHIQSSQFDEVNEDEDEDKVKGIINPSRLYQVLGISKEAGIAATDADAHAMLLHSARRVKKKKKTQQQQKSKKSKKDVKNVVKNIYRLFMIWIE